jgi:hypothetical protein
MRQQLSKLSTLSIFSSVLLTVGLAQANPAEIYCTIKGANLVCQILGKERKVMSSEDVANFIDQSESNSYVTVKSRKGYERTFQVDAHSAQFKHLSDIKNSGSVSEVATAKTSLFGEIEKRTVKLSDELDGQAAATDFVLYDPAVTYEKMKREAHDLTTEVESYRKNREKMCTSTPAFEALTKASARLQQTLSNIVYAWQTPSTCMSSYKIYRDKDGAIDLRQLDSSVDHYKAECKAK